MDVPEYINDLAYVNIEEFRMSDISFSEDLILKKMQQLVENKAAGHNGIPPIILSKMADVLCKPLFKIFQMSFDSGCVTNE